MLVNQSSIIVLHFYIKMLFCFTWVPLYRYCAYFIFWLIDSIVNHLFPYSVSWKSLISNCFLLVVRLYAAYFASSANTVRLAQNIILRKFDWVFADFAWRVNQFTDQFRWQAWMWCDDYFDPSVEGLIRMISIHRISNKIGNQTVECLNSSNHIGEKFALLKMQKEETDQPGYAAEVSSLRSQCSRCLKSRRSDLCNALTLSCC